METKVKKSKIKIYYSKKDCSFVVLYDDVLMLMGKAPYRPTKDDVLRNLEKRLSRPLTGTRTIGKGE